LHLGNVLKISSCLDATLNLPLPDYQIFGEVGDSEVG